MKILSVMADAKTSKGFEYGYLTGIIYLAPSNESGVINTCTHASAGCREACLYTAGCGVWKNVKAARVAKTVAFVNDKATWMRQLMVEIVALERKAKKLGKLPAVRLNGTSDLDWENILIKGKTLMQHFPHIPFYDYTKNPVRMTRFLSGQFCKNYHLTFSRSENNQPSVKKVISEGGNVAVVFRGGLPETYLGRPVVNGDTNDLRFADPQGCIVGLVAKGKARKADAGFVVEVQQ